jgi:RHS repeat-associated protein
VAQFRYSTSYNFSDGRFPRMYLDYYSHDGLGSVATLTHYEDDENHQPIRYRYSAFGAIVQGDFTNNPYGYTSRRFDHENGFYHYHFRKYDPVTGNWLTPDPIGIMGGINLYRFVQNNPVNYRDWLGLAIEAGTGLSDGSNDHDGDGISNENDSNPYSYDPPSDGIEESLFSPLDLFGFGIGYLGKAIGKAFGKFGKAIGKAFSKAFSRSPRNISDDWAYGKHKSIEKWQNQMKNRGWSEKQISEAIAEGKRYPATNNVNKGNSATRYEHPETGRSVVCDDVTKEVLQVGDDGFLW